ncbi:hypothetical protein EDB89DRAFT_1909378 [Lactarius sanguifluus]|nr:hypothetical protein EDB89DRAFT_1909378 [Lactarius sanguifluus]
MTVLRWYRGPLTVVVRSGLAWRWSGVAGVVKGQSRRGSRRGCWGDVLSVAAGVMLAWRGWRGMGRGLGRDVVARVVSVAMRRGLRVTLGVPSWWVLHVATAWRWGGAFARRGTGGGGGCEDEATRAGLSHGGVLVVVEVVETRPQGSCSGDGDVVYEKRYGEKRKKKKNVSKQQTEAELVVIGWGLACRDSMASERGFRAAGYWWWWRLWRRGHEVAAAVTVTCTRPKHGGEGYGLMWDEAAAAVTWLCDSEKRLEQKKRKEEKTYLGDEMHEVAPLEKYSKG